MGLNTRIDNGGVLGLITQVGLIMQVGLTMGVGLIMG